MTPSLSTSLGAFSQARPFTVLYVMSLYLPQPVVSIRAGTIVREIEKCADKINNWRAWSWAPNVEVVPTTKASEMITFGMPILFPYKETLLPVVALLASVLITVQWSIDQTFGWWASGSGSLGMPDRYTNKHRFNGGTVLPSVRRVMIRTEVPPSFVIIFY